MCTFEKIRGLAFWTGILVGEWRISVCERKVTKERNVYSHLYTLNYKLHFLYLCGHLFVHFCVLHQHLSFRLVGTPHGCCNHNVVNLEHLFSAMFVLVRKDTVYPNFAQWGIVSSAQPLLTQKLQYPIKYYKYLQILANVLRSAKHAKHILDCQMGTCLTTRGSEQLA